MAGTSSWHNLGYCVDVIMKVDPQSVLDVGAGFGRWGMLVREFCEVWHARYFPQDWALRVDAVEAFPQNICDYHRHFYNEIHLADAADFLTPERCRYDLVILGDVLEHFPRETALGVLERCVAGAGYVLVNIPLGSEYDQEAMYGNRFERHQSTWHVSDFTARPDLRHHRLFRDFRSRPFGSFVLSRQDPKGVAKGLFSEHEGAPGDPGLAALAARVAALKRDSEQLHAILGSRSWALLTWLRTTPLLWAPRRLWRLLRGR